MQDRLTLSKHTSYHQKRDAIIKLILQWDSTQRLQFPAPRGTGNCDQIAPQPRVPFQFRKGMRAKTTTKQP